ncbi:energy-coupling factor transporter transmembrane component T family protein [Frigoribacterium faeni]|uniref:ABC transporter n=1 Tax=Frigoribacterium faeni TaxID=145483 RepID=A0A7W3JIB1_9MICO|nr:energy-coupling factor transporter transmembrane component T [Frigoribacterium faeni]MBA8813381.1 energy-coupling factor transport system permease protein [Frigoribacterium faeni]BFF14613.1 energy-coupling factor transporter transmembrane component T [Microbacterium flavescens]GEK83103.1 ABC transporter [Frigoribacterium faeni]
MSVLTPIVASGAVGRVNPVAKLLAAVVLAVALLLSIDWVSAGTALVLEALLLPFAGLSARQLLTRTAPLWIAAPTSVVAVALYGRDGGATLLQLGFVSVTDGSLALAGAIGLRILAVGIPGIVLFATTDPTDLADGLGQVLRLPSRFVLGGLAGLRLVGLFMDDWRQLALARRARGVADSGGPIGALRRFGQQAFALLVLSVRRGSKLATAMEAKGFGSDRPRTWARPSTFGARDAALVGIGVVVAAAAVTAAVLAGTWAFVLG